MKQKSNQLKAVVWSAIERFSVQGVQFLVSIVLARLLSPENYGIIAMLSIFLALASTFIDSGFGNALIQKKNVCEKDFTTVFYFNLFVAIGIYVVLYFTSGYIADFYKEPILEDVTKVSAIGLVISSLSIVQRTKLTIELDFKTQFKASLISVIGSGFIGVILAYYGFGVWALVAQSIISALLTTICLWYLVHWKPLLLFSYKSFRTLFSFGSKILITGLISTLYSNLYTLIIGKFYNSSQLGFFNRANTLAQFPSKNFTGIISRVSYPVQCELQDDDKKLSAVFLKTISISSYVIFPFMCCLAVLSKPFIILLLSEKWIEAAPLLSIMSIAFMFDHIQFFNWQLICVKGRSDKSLYAEIIKKIVSIAILIITLPFGIKILTFGLLIYALADIIIIIPFVRSVIAEVNYASEMKALAAPLIYSLCAAFSAYCVSLLIENILSAFIISSITAIIVFCGLSYIFKSWQFDFILSKLNLKK